MKLSLDIRTSLTQTLTPQQIQYLKLLQLPVVQLENQIMQEIEQNPMLEADIDDDIYIESEGDFNEDKASNLEYSDDKTSKEKAIDDQGDPFEFHKLIWQDDIPAGRRTALNNDDDDNEPFQIRDTRNFLEELTYQLRMIPMKDEEYILGDQIIGNIDNDGYLRRDLSEIVDETNGLIAELNYAMSNEMQEYDDDFDNPARNFSLSNESTGLLARVYSDNPEIANFVREFTGNRFSEKEESKSGELSQIDLETADKVLAEIRQLDPPGIGSRSIQECLLAQCKAFPDPSPAQKLAIRILDEAYESFAKKHFHIINKQLGISDDDIRDAIEVIRRLNPKPGGGDYQSEINTVIPDFVIEIDEETRELMININDSRIPAIKLSKAYEKLKKDTQYKLSNKETKEWIRNKYEDAKFLIQAIRQRKSTMLKVMTAIAELQKGFFFEGPTALKPLIYKNVAETTGLDISTVCRIVNGKYVQTRYGTFELKFFFSESLPTDEGEEVSTRVIKGVIKDIIDEESKKKPLSDERIAKDLKEKGFNVARRTVAKYREQMKIPVARLRKELL